MKFWAYLHTNGTIQLKRYWESEIAATLLKDARESAFVVRVVGPFEADLRTEAERIARQLLSEAESKPKFTAEQQSVINKAAKEVADDYPYQDGSNGEFCRYCVEYSYHKHREDCTWWTLHKLFHPEAENVPGVGS